MQFKRWKIVERLLEQVEGTAGRLVMAVAPDPLDVVLYEAPVLGRSQSPQNPLRGFVQEAVLLLEQPTAAEIAAFLHLPSAVVEPVLGHLQRVGGAVSDNAGRWSVPGHASRFGTGGSDPPIWRRTRRLFCYSPELQVLLPVLPRLRLRDLVELDVHKLQSEVAEWYDQVASWTAIEGLKRGRPDSICILPLAGNAVVLPGSLSPTPVEPLALQEVLVHRCRLDVIALTWVSYHSGIWEVTSRLWSRPTPNHDAAGEPFSPGAPMLGLSLPESLLGGSALNDLAKLFDSNSEEWRELILDQSKHSSLRRDLETDSHASILSEQVDYAGRQQWQGVLTTLSREARLLCYTIPLPLWK